MFGIVRMSPFLKHNKTKYKFNLTALGYGYSTNGIKRFQKENGLPQTGFIDHCTGYLIEKRME